MPDPQVEISARPAEALTPAGIEAGSLDPATQRRLAGIAAQVERKTGIRLLPVLAASSSRYERSSALAGVYAALCASLGLYLFRADDPPLHWLIPLQGLAFLAGAGLAAKSPWIRYLLSGRMLMHQRVREAAERSLATARGGSAGQAPILLVYVSWLEREVVVLAENRAAQPILPSTCARIRDQVLAGLGAKTVGEALCENLSGVGDLLAAQPAGADSAGSVSS